MYKRIKKINKLTLMFLLAFMTIFSLNTTTNINATTDYSNKVVIDDWDILDSSSKPLSTTNTASYLNDYQFKISWSLSSVGDTLHADDTLSIPLPKNDQIGFWSAVNSTFEDFKDENGNVIGKWRINNAKIEVILTDNAEGLNSITVNFLTGKNALRNYNTSGIIQNVSVGNNSKSIKFNASSIQPLKDTDQKYAAQTSNSRIRWGVTINNAGSVDLSKQEWGKNFTIKKDTYFEDTSINEAKNISLSTITANVQYPIDLTTGTASLNGTSFKITSKFTEIFQNADESYTIFKSRLKPLEWGVYTDANGTKTVVVYFGDIGDNGLKYSDITSNFANTVASNAIKDGFYTEEDRSALVDYFNRTYGNQNIIVGNIARYAVTLNTDYNKVILDTKKTNTATVTMNDISRNLTSAGILQGNMGNTSVSKNATGLFLYDENTNALLPDATFKLEYNNAGTWKDYASTETMTTDAAGFVQTPTLGNRKYRFIQLTPSTNEYDLLNSQGYDSVIGNVVSSEFTINSVDTEGIKVSVSNVKFKFDVTYNKGDYGKFDDEVYNKVVINSNTPLYSQTPKGIDGYIFTGWSPSIADTVTENIVYIAQWKASEYKINYVLDGGINSSKNPSTYEFGVGVNSFENASKTNYKFLGWYDAPTGSNSFTSISTTDTGDKTLYARWKKQSILQKPDSAKPNEIIKTKKSNKENRPNTVPNTGDSTNLIILLFVLFGFILNRIRKILK